MRDNAHDDHKEAYRQQRAVPCSVAEIETTANLNRKNRSRDGKRNQQEERRRADSYSLRIANRWGIGRVFETRNQDDGDEAGRRQQCCQHSWISAAAGAVRKGKDE